MSIGINLRVTGHTSIGGRKYQEDFFSVAYQQTENDQSLEYAFFGIYDGHGGAEASLYAREHLMNTIVSQKLFWSENDEDVLKAIRDGYIQTHYSMWREQGKKGYFSASPIIVFIDIRHFLFLALHFAPLAIITIIME